jgi:uncharacterized phage infection (PIP) family protein YhgE
MFDFFRFPYTNFDNINLDWILEKIQGLDLESVTEAADQAEAAAQTATQAAQTATQAAQQAVTTIETVADQAADAVETANAAAAAAGSVESIAEAAQNSAAAAQTAAATAQSTAQQAQSTAQQAQTGVAAATQAAQDATQAASNASTAAQQALTTAQQAQLAANNAQAALTWKLAGSSTGTGAVTIPAGATEVMIRVNIGDGPNGFVFNYIPQFISGSQSFNTGCDATPSGAILFTAMCRIEATQTTVAVAFMYINQTDQTASAHILVYYR